MMNFLIVALGGALGASARYGVGLLCAGAAFPWATLSVNLIGCTLMGFMFHVLGAQSASATKLFLMTGILGGFTTFSAFGLDALNLYQRGDMSQALVYVAASVVLGIAGVAIGIAVARLVI